MPGGVLGLIEASGEEEKGEVPVEFGHPSGGAPLFLKV